MRFNVAWSETLDQNTVLRFTVLILAVCLLGLLVALTKIILKEPIVIERACYSNSIAIAPTKHTEQEIKAFIKEAISQRFDSHVEQNDYLSLEQRLLRETERKELTEKNIEQRVIVNVKKIEGSQITVDADRLIAVGAVRSVLKFPLVVTIATVSRSNGNPYGLLVTEVKNVEENKIEKSN